MNVVYEDDSVTLIHGDWRTMVDRLPLADCVITDPPYGETSLEWDRWPDGWPSLVRERSMWCFGSLRMFMDRRGDFEGWQHAQEIVWEKHNGSSFHADRFKRVHELAVHFYRGQWADVWREPVMVAEATARTVRRKGRPAHTGHIGDHYFESHDGGPKLQRSVIFARSCHGYAVHPTQKPLEIVEPLVAYACPPGGLVLDPFAGSGTTLLAAKRLGRRAIGVEAREDYCEAAVARLSQGVFGLEAS